MDKFKDYIIGEYLKRQNELGKILQQNEFGEWLGLSKAQISQYVNGIRVPNHDTLDLLSVRLGPQVYDAAGVKRPDPLLDEIIAVYDEIPPDDQDELFDWIVRWARERGFREVER